MSRIFEYNGVQLEMDMLDAAFVEKYENAFKRMGEAEEALRREPNIGSASERIRKYCQMFYDLYDDIFGAGTSEKMFGGTYNMRFADESYAAFLKAARSGQAEAEESRAKWKYAVNRDNRRENDRNYRRKRR